MHLYAQKGYMCIFADFFYSTPHQRKKNGDSNNTNINNNNPNEWSHRIMKSEERTEPRSSVFKLTMYIAEGSFCTALLLRFRFFFRNRSNRRVQRDSPIEDGVSYIRKMGEDLLLSCVPFISVISILFFLSTKRKDE